MAGRLSCNKSMISNDVQGKFTLGWLSGGGRWPYNLIADLTSTTNPQYQMMYKESLHWVGLVEEGDGPITSLLIIISTISKMYIYK